MTTDELSYSPQSVLMTVAKMCRVAERSLDQEYQEHQAGHIRKLRKAPRMSRRFCLACSNRPDARRAGRERLLGLETLSHLAKHIIDLLANDGAELI